MGVARTIAVVGASTDRRKFGNKCVRAYAHDGWTVFPVNPRSREIEGLECYPSLGELPTRPERISVYLPPPVTLEALAEIAAIEADLTFFNPGTTDEAVVSKAREMGIEFTLDCSIVDIGLSPSQFPAD